MTDKNPFDKFDPFNQDQDLNENNAENPNNSDEKNSVSQNEGDNNSTSTNFEENKRESPQPFFNHSEFLENAKKTEQEEKEQVASFLLDPDKKCYLKYSPEDEKTHQAPAPKQKSRGGFIFLMVAICFMSAFFGANLGALGGKVVLYEAVPQPTPLDGGRFSYAEVSDMVASTVVEITTEQVTTSGIFGQYITQGAGSGVIISGDGYIITNHHVIENATKIGVRTHDGKVYEATLIGSDQKTDIAVIKINGEFQPAVFGDSTTIRVGEEVIAIGNPLGELGGSVSNGIISALDREISVEGNTMTLLQTSAAINPGNSGGGLFNMKGELIGIVNAKSQGSEIDNIGFAIPTEIAKKVASEIIEYGYVRGRVSIGIQVVDIQDRATAQHYGVSKLGVYIMSSSQASLKNGDLILSIDGYLIRESEDITSALSDKQIGDQIQIIVERAGKQETVSVKLAEFKPS